MSTFQSDNDIFKKHFAKNLAADLEHEKCTCVKIVLAKLCNLVPKDYSKSLEKIRQKLIDDGDETILQHMPTLDQGGTKAEKNRRYLALNYGSENNDMENQALSEEEWLAKEQKDIEEVEKTVNIRFANYTTMMRAQTLTAGLNQQLAMFLKSLG